MSSSPSPTLTRRYFLDRTRLGGSPRFPDLALDHLEQRLIELSNRQPDDSGTAQLNRRLAEAAATARVLDDPRGTRPRGGLPLVLLAGITAASYPLTHDWQSTATLSASLIAATAGWLIGCRRTRDVPAVEESLRSAVIVVDTAPDTDTDDLSRQLHRIRVRSACHNRGPRPFVDERITQAAQTLARDASPVPLDDEEVWALTEQLQALEDQVDPAGAPAHAESTVTPRTTWCAETFAA